MKQKLRLPVLLILVLSVLCSQRVFAAKEALAESIRESAKGLQQSFETRKSNLLSEEEILPPGNSASDWIAMVLAFSGEKDAYSDYLKRLEMYVVERYEQQGYLEDVKATEYHRIGLTMLALGGDPTKIQRGDQMINLVADGTWNFHGGSPGEQGTNGLIYGLLLLDARDDFLPQEEADFRQKLISDILDTQEENGGFVLSKSLGTDVDVTAMVLQALAPYQEQPKVKEATEKALEWLSGKLSDNATYISYDTESVESIAQTVLALCAIGIDPAEDVRFIKDGQTLLDSMENFRLEDGQYKHEIHDEDSNIAATYQALLALEAVQKLRTEGTWIFDFEGYELPEGTDSSGGNLMIPVITGIAAVAAVGTAVFIKKKQKNKQKA